MNNSSPCKDCPTRYIGCHGQCEQYKLWAFEQHQAKRKSIDSFYARQYVPDNLCKYHWHRMKDKMARGRGKIT